MNKNENIFSLEVYHFFIKIFHTLNINETTLH